MKSGFKLCPSCNGSGEEEVEHFSTASFSNSYGDIYTTIETCEQCDGNGSIEDEEE